VWLLSSSQEVHRKFITFYLFASYLSAHRLAPLYPDTLMVGMEIRAKVSAYVRERIGAVAADCCSSVSARPVQRSL
jgi:hypothetical protein